MLKLGLDLTLRLKALAMESKGPDLVLDRLFCVGSRLFIWHSIDACGYLWTYFSIKFSIFEDMGPLSSAFQFKIFNIGTLNPQITNKRELKSFSN